MPKIRHALSGAVYDADADGGVVVDKDGVIGHFDKEGNWLDGELRVADPEMCRWIADPQLENRHRQALAEQAAAATGGRS